MWLARMMGLTSPSTTSVWRWCVVVVHLTTNLFVSYNSNHKFVCSINIVCEWWYRHWLWFWIIWLNRVALYYTIWLHFWKIYYFHLAPYLYDLTTTTEDISAKSKILRVLHSYNYIWANWPRDTNHMYF